MCRRRRQHAPFALLKGTGETHWSVKLGDSAGLSLSAKMAVDFSDSYDMLVFGVPYSEL
jgi:hypothetical protein